MVTGSLLQSSASEYSQLGPENRASQRQPPDGLIGLIGTSDPRSGPEQGGASSPSARTEVQTEPSSNATIVSDVIQEGSILLDAAAGDRRAA